MISPGAGKVTNGVAERRREHRADLGDGAHGELVRVVSDGDLEAADGDAGGLGDRHLDGDGDGSTRLGRSRWG